jgi:hypothetical protein
MIMERLDIFSNAGSYIVIDAENNLKCIFPKDFKYGYYFFDLYIIMIQRKTLLIESIDIMNSMKEKEK